MWYQSKPYTTPALWGEKIHTSSRCDANGYSFPSASRESADFPQCFTGSGLNNWEVFDEIQVLNGQRRKQFSGPQERQKGREKKNEPMKELIKSVTFRSFWQKAPLQRSSPIQETLDRHLEVSRIQANTEFLSQIGLMDSLLCFYCPQLMFWHAMCFTCASCV